MMINMPKGLVWKKLSVGRVAYTYREIVGNCIRKAGEKGITSNEIAEQTGLKVDTVRSKIRTLDEWNRVFSTKPHQEYGKGKPYKIWKDIKYAKKQSKRQKKKKEST
jgi:transcription initiation factor IIE alpha subunit